LNFNPKNPQYNFEIGIAYLRSPKEFPKAQQYLENALKYSTQDTIEELFFYLGKAYQNNHDFQKAKESYKNFDRFIKPTKSGADLKTQVDWLKKTCNHGEYHVKLNTKNPLENKSKPINNTKKYFLNSTDYVIMQNLGAKINSINNDENAVFLNGEKEIYFTSMRNPFANPNEITYGKDFEQVYVSRIENDDWRVPELIRTLNLFPGDFDAPSAHVSIVALNKDENFMILYNNEDLFWTEKGANTWTEPKKFNSKINVKGSRQPSACLSDDGSILMVISDQEGGYGGRDIYMSKKDDKGEWGELTNLGSVVNTEQDEDTPFLIGNDLMYFSSKGHSSIGGYDVFFSKFDGTKWSNPQSLGIPINTPQDEIAYVRSKVDPLISYYSSARVDGYGYKDIYKITSFYKTRKREDLPAVALSDFLTDDLKRKQKEEQAAKDSALAVVENPVTEVTAVAVPDNSKSENNEVKEDPKSSSSTATSSATPTPLPKADEDLFRDILFSFNGNKLTPESEVQVQKIAEYMKQNPEFVIALAGHADYLGSNEVNDRISRERALIVTNKLVAAGVNPYNVNYAYFGESKPKADGKNADGSDNPEGRAKNRRVEFDLNQNRLFRVVTFGSNSYALGSKEKSILEEVATMAKSNSNYKIKLSGFSDSVGNAEYNKKLSEKRVNAAAEELKKLGVNASQISTEFFGEERPSAPGTNERRVEIRIQ
jgi:outer membrane protein OmpA-like peptidoglycan-associated protein